MALQLTLPRDKQTGAVLRTGAAVWLGWWPPPWSGQNVALSSTLAPSGQGLLRRAEEELTRPRFLTQGPKTSPGSGLEQGADLQCSGHWVGHWAVAGQSRRGPEALPLRGSVNCAHPSLAELGLGHP